MFCYLNGKFYNQKQAHLSVDNRSFRYGDGCFETMKMVEGKLCLSAYHFERLFNTLKQLQFTWPSYFTPNYIAEIVQQLAAKNNHLALARIRITIYRGDGAMYDVEHNTAQMLVQSWDLNVENNNLNENGLILGVYNQGFKAADAFANLKHNNFLLYSMAAHYAKQQHWNDAVVLNHNNYTADTTMANIWAIKNDILYTPCLASGPVQGVMRRHIITQASANGIQVIEKELAIAFFDEADALFITNAIKGLRWVKLFNDRQFSLHPLITTLFRQIVKPSFTEQ